MAGEEKTEKATPKKRKDAREKEGNVLQSKEITTASFVLGIFIFLFITAKYTFQLFLKSIKTFIENVGIDNEINQEFLTNNAVALITDCMILLLPILFVAALLGILPVIIQTKGLFNMKALSPKFSKLNPFTGIKRLFSLQSVVNIIKGILEIAAIVAIVYNQIMGFMNDIKKLPDMELMQGIAFTAQSIFDNVLLICIVLVFIAAGDYLFQWWNYEKKLKMSKQEVKDEYKQMEGDPKIKSKIKQKQREIAQNRMMQEVPTSDVVVRNPTHYAVALRYNPDKPTSAPVVVAKGKDVLALKIIEIAEENDVFIKEDRPLARTLYETVDIGREIPVSLYNLIATVISEMYMAKGKKLELPSGRNTVYT